MKTGEGRVGKIDFHGPLAYDIVVRFLKRSGYKFEYSKMVGRRFGDVGDHNRFLSDGGCSEIVGALIAG